MYRRRGIALVPLRLCIARPASFLAAKAPVVASRLFAPSRISAPRERPLPPPPQFGEHEWRPHRARGREVARPDRRLWPSVHTKCRYKPREELSAWAAGQLNAHKLEPAAATRTEGADGKGKGHESRLGI